MSVRIVSASLAWLWIGLTATGAAAQHRDYIVVMGDRGAQKVVAVGAVNKLTCESVAPTLILRTFPTRGSVKISEIKAKMPASADACADKDVARTLVEYTPNPGEAKVFDRFYLFEAGPRTKSHEREIVVWIADPKTPNTAPPTRAAVDHLFGSPKSLSAALEEQAARKPAAPAASPPPASAPTSAGTSGVTAAGPRLVVDQGVDGHYRVKVAIKGSTFDGLIDTGASFVYMSEKLARKIGLAVSDSFPTLPVQTASGISLAKLLLCPEIRVGPFIERDVLCAVAPKGIETPTLIGMSFLRRLQSVQISDNRLTLSR